MRNGLLAAAAVAMLASHAATASAQSAPAKSGPAKSAPAQSAPANSGPAPARDSRDINLRAYVELLRSDVRSQKVAILTEMMDFTEKEDAAFWPIYREYDVELSKLNDERVRLIGEYAKTYSGMTDANADKIATAALELEGRRHALKLKYYDRVKTALSARQAARFLQIENQLLMLIDLQIAAALPVIE
jgi:hypothetical protein